jgi:hypothetical protein
MTIPIGRRRLVLTLLPPTRRPAVDVPAALDATDAELVRLAGPAAADLDRARWEAMRLMYGPHLG